MTNDSAKPINDARLAALEELSALDQELELKYGIVGNPMIKAEDTMPVAWALQPVHKDISTPMFQGGELDSKSDWRGSIPRACAIGHQ